MEKLSKNHLSKILRYKQKKYIQSDNLILVEGYRLLKQIAEYKTEFEEIYVGEKNDLDLQPFNYKIGFTAPDYYFNKISSTKNPQPIAALIKYKPLPFPNDFSKIIYLENIKDPGNLGTIIRSAVAFGFDGVILSENSVSVLNDKVIRSSMGAIFAIPVKKSSVDNIASPESVLIVADNSENALNLKNLKINFKKIIIAIGSEAFGLSDKTKQLADYIVKIPVKNMESLNAAISAAIFMYEFYENR